jgi:predicted metal-dependent hydrolase
MNRQNHSETENTKEYLKQSTEAQRMEQENDMMGDADGSNKNNNNNVNEEEEEDKNLDPETKKRMEQEIEEAIEKRKEVILKVIKVKPQSIAQSIIVIVKIDFLGMQKLKEET